MELNWGDSALRARMKQGWRGGLRDGTICGGGSTLQATSDVRAALPSMVRKYGIRTVCDAGAGDLHWIGLVKWQVRYQAFDLVPRTPSIEQHDISQKRLPSCDLILCRHVLIHLDPARIDSTLKLFRSSAKYLLASQYDNAPRFDASKQYNPTDLRAYLGEPLERLKDTGSDLALWEL